MAFFTGRSGALYLTTAGSGEVNPASSEAVLKLRDWSLETTLELLETTTVDTAVKSYTPGAVSSTGSATVLYYRSEVGDVGTQFTSLLNKVMKTATTGVSESDRVGMVLRAGTTAGSGSDVKDDIVFNAYITSASMQVTTAELTSVAIQFTVDGPFREVIDA
jgi:hypothetical protein